MCPIGGGGLSSGTALAARYFAPGVRVVAAEPAGADDAYRSFKSGVFVPQTAPKTIADGLLTSLGSSPFPIVLDALSDIVTVSEQSIVRPCAFCGNAARSWWSPRGPYRWPRCWKAKERPGTDGGADPVRGNVDLDRLPWTPGA
jgi:threonine dehydratase